MYNMNCHVFSIFLFRHRAQLWATSDRNPSVILTKSFIGYPVHVQDEVILEDDVSNDGEEVDQDESQDGGQNDRAAVPGYTLDDV